MSEDRKPWIAGWFLLHNDDRSGLFVCLIKGFRHLHCGGWIFVFSSWRNPTLNKKGEKQKNQLEVVAIVTTTEIEYTDRLNEMCEACWQRNWQIGYDGSKQKEGCRRNSAWVRGIRVFAFSSSWFPWEAIYLTLSFLPAPLLRSRVLYLVCKFTKYNLANLSQLHSLFPPRSAHLPAGSLPRC